MINSPATATVTNNGNTVVYTFLVSNEGNVDLHNVGVTDVLTNPALGTIGAVTCTGGTNGGTPSPRSVPVVTPSRARPPSR